MPLKRIKTPRAIPIFPLWKLVLMPIPSSLGNSINIVDICTRIDDICISLA